MNLVERITRTNRLALESSITKAEVLVLYKNEVSLPSRRFRVEGGFGGNSRLLTNRPPTEANRRPGMAQRVHRQNGGEIVEVFTAADWWTDKAKGLHACDRCKAEQGKPCMSKGKPTTGRRFAIPPEVIKPHAIRYEEPIDNDVMVCLVAHAGEALKVKRVASIVVAKPSKVSAALIRLVKAGSIRKTKGGYMLAVAPLVEAAA